MYKKFLSQLGLTEPESEIYLYLIENKISSISDISKSTGIHRPKLYQIIPTMIERGIIASILQGKRTLYQAENPQVLQGYFESLKKDCDYFIPEITELYKNNEDKPVFKNVVGKKGIKFIFLDIAHTLKKGDVFYRYSARNNIEKTSISENDYGEYRKIREEKQLQRMVITSEYLQSLKDNRLEKEVVVVPHKMDIFEDNITKIIYGNKVAIIDYNTQVSFVIESKVFAGFEKKLFLMLFRFLQKMDR